MLADVLRAREDYDARVEGLIDLAPRLSEQQLAQALENLSSLRIYYVVARGLSGLAPYLNEQLLSSAVVIADGISDHKFRNSFRMREGKCERDRTAETIAHEN